MRFVSDGVTCLFECVLRELSWKALSLVCETIVERGAMSGPAVEINDLWFSYEVAEVIGGNAKSIDKDAGR